MTTTYPYTLLQPEHREEMAAWLEDGQQPGDQVLRQAITHDRTRGPVCTEHLGRGQCVVQDLVDWLHDHAPPTAWGYPEALEVWPSARMKLRRRPACGVAS